LRRITVVVEPKVVALAHAVDRDRVVAVVDAADLERIGIGRVDPGLRVNADHVLDVATDGRQFLHFALAEARTHADRHVALRGADDLDARERLDRLGEEGHRGALRELGIQLLHRCFLHPRHLRGDTVGPADAQTVGSELAAGVRHGDLGGAGRHVRDRDAGALDRPAVGAEHEAGELARRLLGGGELRACGERDARANGGEAGRKTSSGHELGFGRASAAYARNVTAGGSAPVRSCARAQPSPRS
jgi:hypothetical protein